MTDKTTIRLVVEVEVNYPVGSEPIDLSKASIETRLPAISGDFEKAEQRAKPGSRPRPYYQTRAKGITFFSKRLTPDKIRDIAREWTRPSRCRYLENIQQWYHPRYEDDKTTMWQMDAVYGSINANGNCHQGPIRELLLPWADPGMFPAFDHEGNKVPFIYVPSSTAKYDVTIPRDVYLALKAEYHASERAAKLARLTS